MKRPVQAGHVERNDLKATFVQLQQFALPLKKPPLLVTCDLDRFVIRTNWTNAVCETHKRALFSRMLDASACGNISAALAGTLFHAMREGDKS